MSMLRVNLVRRVILFGAALASGVVYADAADVFVDTEFAARWDLAVNPGKDAAWLQAKLFPKQPVEVGLAAKEVSTEVFAIRYFDWNSPAPGDSPFREIVRERQKTKGSKVTYELMYKQRGRDSFEIATNACRLETVDGKTPEGKAEVDASLATDGTFTRSYSYSCDLKKGAKPFVPPTALQVTPQPCFTAVTRLEVETSSGAKIKIETWKLPGGDLIEVSSSDLNEEAFKGSVGKLITDDKLQLSTEGKTQTAGKCAAELRN